MACQEPRHARPADMLCHTAHFSAVACVKGGTYNMNIAGVQEAIGTTRATSQASQPGVPYFFAEAAFLALSVVPSVRESFDRICGDGIALPLSYS